MTKSIFKTILLFSAIIIFSGCAKLAHLQELLTLKAMSDEADKTDKYVKEQDRKFGLLLEAKKDGTIESYKDKKTIVKKFGDPVFCRNETKLNREVEECLYRYAKKFFDSEKIYFYFDSSGQVVTWEFHASEPEICSH